MTPPLTAGAPFPDLTLPDHAGNARRLSELVAGDPTVLHFYRGWWCPKEQRYFRRLLELQEEAEVPYVPRVFTLSPVGLRIHAVYDGYWYSGRATLEELRRDLRAIQRAVRPDWEAPTA
jgi:thiol-disulfide isomerase/thioredoxin